MNKIKSIKEYEILGEDKQLVKVENFDENENLLSRIYYEDGEISGKEIRQFNEKNQVVNYKEFENDTDLSISSIFDYDENGNLISEEQTFVHAGSYKSFKKYEYSDNSEIINITDDDGEFEGKIITKFNDNKNITEKQVFNDYNEIEEHFTNEYNNENQLIKTINFATGNSNYNEHLYFYNENNQVTEEKIVNKKGKIQQHILRTYDDQNRQTSIKLADVQNKKSAEYTFEYSNEKTEISIYESKNLIKKEITFIDNNKKDIKYIEQTDFENGIPQTVSEVVYEYDFFE